MDDARDSGPLTLTDGVAVIGLGRMGRPMARNLRTAGFRVVGYDVDEARTAEAAALGVEIAASPAEAAATTAAALIVVGFEPEVRHALTDPETGLIASAGPGYVAAICSTVEPSCSIELAAASEGTNVRVVDATLCLGEPSAEDGSLLVMCGGDPAALARIEPALRVIGSELFRLGTAGAGQVGKMLNNYLLWASVVANHEAMRLGGRLNLELEPLRQALMRSSGNNWALETWTRSRPMPWAEDDMRIVKQYADEVELDMPSAQLVQRLIEAIKVEKNAWSDGGGSAASMDAFTRAHL